MSTVGPGAAAMANEAETINIAEDLSSAVHEKKWSKHF